MLWWFAETTFVAALLACVAALAGRLRTIGPSARHVLWLVVLIKLITPPLIKAPWAVDLWPAREVRAMEVAVTPSHPTRSPKRGSTMAAIPQSPGQMTARSWPPSRRDQHRPAVAPVSHRDGDSSRREGFGESRPDLLASRSEPDRAMDARRLVARNGGSWSRADVSDHPFPSTAARGRASPGLGGRRGPADGRSARCSGSRDPGRSESRDADALVSGPAQAPVALPIDQVARGLALARDPGPRAGPS